jgi:hypothetical protein
MGSDQRAPGERPRVLVFSERNIFERAVWRCSFQELEGILPELDSVDVLAPRPSRWYTQGKRLALRSGRYFKRPFNPGIPEIRLKRDYDLFFTVCEKPSELLSVSAVKGIKDRCRTSVCWLSEFYVKDIPLLKSCIEVLSRFDHVLIMQSATDSFQKILPGKCRYLPAGVDAIQFCPYPDPPKRSVDVLSIGRRSGKTHQALLQLARDGKLFYVYDTIDDLKAYDLAEHRFMFANLARRSRYFIVNPGKINLPDETGGQSEFGYRYFEGAAPGAILIGERPRNEEFEKVFYWEDAVIDLPFGSDRIGEVIRELDAQPERQKRVRTKNVVESLLRHDWAHRWETILRIAGLAPLDGLRRRQQTLRELASLAEERGVD